MQDKISAMTRACTVGNIVDAVQVLLAIFVVHVLTPGSDDLDGIMMEENFTGGTKHKRPNGNF